MKKFILATLFITTSAIAQQKMFIRDGNNFTQPVNYADSVNTFGIEIDSTLISNISIKYARFKIPVIFFDVYFGNNAIFQRSIVDSNIIFNRTHFFANADFRNIEFNSKISFSSTNFNSESKFNLTMFKSDTDFFNCLFELNSIFNNAKFSSNTLFEFTRFNSTVSFKRAEFHSNLYFNNAKFFSNSSFESVIFDGLVDFSEAWLCTHIYFNEASFNGPVIFNKTIIPQYLDFRHIITIAEEIDFTYAKLDTTKDYRCNIALAGTDPGKLKLDYKLFKLWFPAPDTTYQQKISVYEKLLEKFRKDGFLESFQALDIEYRDFKYSYKGQHMRNFFQKHWWNYGYEKGRIFWWIFVFVGLFTLSNLYFYKPLNERIYSIPFLQFKAIPSKFKNALLHFSTTLLYTSFIFFGLKMDLDKFKKEHIPGNLINQALLFYLLFIYGTGLICVAYLANFIISR